MTTNGLDIIEIRRIQADGKRELIRLDRRLQAIIEKLLSIGAEVEDEHTGSIRLDLGEERGDRVRVKAKVEKVY